MEAIEPHIRDDQLPDSSVLVVRGGPITSEKLLEAAKREQAVYTWRGRPLACISAEAVTGEWSLERLLAEHLGTRTTYATTTVGQVVDAGLALLPTFAVPHYDVVLEDATPQEVARLMSILSEPVRNQFRRKGR
ncbi:MAG TPA: hypothetical protein VMF65_02865 [Acidimicrobiales bacterium]|nr:hypothetical protein [Acidimicrobiales bacterium]